MTENPRTVALIATQQALESQNPDHIEHMVDSLAAMRDDAIEELVGADMQMSAAGERLEGEVKDLRRRLDLAIDVICLPAGQARDEAIKEMVLRRG